ncbi:transposase (plasmid) [Paracoccus versutus]|jgi:hypothetical protein|uniref:Helix-turn-helix protein n=1 Tax=Paracoccus versutus TaxID=34007 RepID=A0AAQ0KMP6_PARVE|nr:helix-turn-helix protein [Paracoccus versutus]WEJ81270.1 transposase [Paracoccus versutus]
MTWHLRNEGHVINEKRVRRLMRLMGLMPIYQKPNTSRPAKGHKIWPYLQIENARQPLHEFRASLGNNTDIGGRYGRWRQNSQNYRGATTLH